jgi:hypothetical protein
MSASDRLRQVDWWPFTRITITAAILGLAAHLFLGWQPPLRQLLAMPGQVLGIVSLAAMISFALADLYLLVFLVPLLIVGILNDWFYSASRWACRRVLRIKSGAVLTSIGLCGEIVLFAGFVYALRVLAHYF